MNYFVVLLIIGCLGFTNAEKELRKAVAVFDGQVSGNVTFTQTTCSEPVLIEVYINGLSKGNHGFHVHEKGDLRDGCTASGGHFNPDRVDHGAPNDHVRHVGDLGNINADESGAAVTKFSDQVITLFGTRSIIGRAVVIHSGEDDLGRTSHQDSKKTGNAGGRVACSIVGILVSSSDEGYECDRSVASISIASPRFFIYVYVIFMLQRLFN